MDFIDQLRSLVPTDEPATRSKSVPDASQIITSPEELEGLHIIRAVLRDVASPRRIAMRDAQSYCAILLDDNNRKPICRLRFNNTAKLILGLFNGKDEEKISLSDLYEIYSYSDRLKAAVRSHLQVTEAVVAE